MPLAYNYKNYLLTILLIVQAFAFLDRVALGIVLQDIKIDLDLTDTQLGLLTGLAFALFYAVMGIPIARWADRGNRVTIISLAVALWSALVALCGAATNFTQLLLIRVGVAVGEAGCHPTALSLISDCFTRAERPRAVSRYFLGWPVALLVSYFAAGWLNELYNWRITFVVLGLPGLVLAALVWFTLREPRRPTASTKNFGTTAVAQSTAPAPQSLRAVCATLWADTAYRHLLFHFSVGAFFVYGFMQWQPAFFMRSHGFDTGKLGMWFALIYGVGGFLGTYLGGSSIDTGRVRLRRRNRFAAIPSTGSVVGLTCAEPI